MPQMRLENTPLVLQDAACYQFALSGSDDQATLTSVSDRFSAIGNYLLEKIVPVGLLNLTIADLDTIRNIANLDNKRIAIMNALCIEFGLTVHGGGGNSPALLGGRFGTDAQMLPEHMWVCDRTYSYDTMPGKVIFRDNDVNGLQPPLERDIPREEIVTIDLAELTVYQQLIVAGNWE